MFGALDALKESCGDLRGILFLEALLQDARYALRRLWKSPAFTIAVILTLALGIGATNSIFTLVHAVIMKSLAVANPRELYRVGMESRCCYWGGYSQEKEFSIFSYDLYKHLRDNTQGFEELAAFQAGESLLGVRRNGTSEPALSYMSEFVSGNYFTMFGLKPFAGRLITPDDNRPGAPLVAVMSYRLWQQHYGSDPGVIGGSFSLDDKPFTIVGVTPPGFFGDTLRNFPPDFFLPLETEPVVQADSALNEISQHWLDLIGRIKPGTKPASVEAEMRVGLKQWLRSHWADMNANEHATFPDQTLFLRPGGAGITSLREQYEHWLQILMMISGFVLLIVCANVAGLMLVRGMERRREVSLSMALGAQGLRLVRQALTESLLLSLVGGAAGLAAAFAGTRLILHFAFPSASGWSDIPISASPSTPVLLFALIVSLVTGLTFGIAPAWMATRVDPIEALRGAGRSTARTGSLPRKTLVVLQTALSLILLAASGLLTAALHHLEKEPFGFIQDRRTVVKIDPRVAGYRLDQLTPLFKRIHDSFMNVPGVSAVAICLYTPLSSGAWGTNVWVDGTPPPGPHDNTISSWDRVTPGYFDVLGTPILEGRGITEQDTATSQHVAVVNEAFARKFLGSQDPIGKHFGQLKLGMSREYEVVGVVPDGRYFNFELGKPIGPLYFMPEAQHDVSPSSGTDITPGSHFLRDIVVVTQPGAVLTVAQARQVMAGIDPNLPVVSFRTLGDQVSGQFRQQTLIARLASFFGILSLVLASIGMYGITAYNAGRRTSEIGVRLALGATRSQAAGLIVRGAFALVVMGLILGLPAALAAGRFLGSQLYGLNPHDPAVILAAVFLLAFSALVAALIPAVRASAISPLEALRSE